MRTTLAFLLLLGLSAQDVVAQAGTDVKAKSPASAYAQDGRGTIMRSGTGLCWRTDFWSPGDAVTGCDGELSPPIVKATAPALLPSAEIAVATAPIDPARRSATCDFNLIFSNDELFRKGGAALSPRAKARITAAFGERASHCDHLDRIAVSGHTDRTGTTKANRLLSERRASAIATELRHLAGGATITALGYGNSQPVAECPLSGARERVKSCLAQNRRAVVAAFGAAKQ